MLVDFVADNSDALVPEQNLAKRLELIARINRAGGISRRVQHQQLGSRRDRRLQTFRCQLEAIGGGTFHFHRLAAGKTNHVGIGYPVGRGNNDLVAGIDGCKERVEDHLLRAGGNDDLVVLVAETVFAKELSCDGLLQCRYAVDIGVAGLAVADRSLSRRPYVVGRIEIRLTHGEADDVMAGGDELPGTHGGHATGRRLDARHARGDKCHLILVKSEKQFQPSNRLPPRHREISG